MLQPTLLDIKRIHALTDGTFAVATTILILNVEVPEGLTIANMHEMLLEKVAPSLFIYMLGFIILGSFWNESHYHHHVVLKSDIVSFLFGEHPLCKFRKHGKHTLHVQHEVCYSQHKQG